MKPGNAGGGGRSGLLPTSLKVSSSCVRTVSTNAGSVVCSAGVSVAVAPSDDDKDGSISVVSRIKNNASGWLNTVTMLLLLLLEKFLCPLVHWLPHFIIHFRKLIMQVMRKQIHLKVC